MIRALVAQDETLLCGALAALLDQEADIEVVAQLADGREVLSTVVWHQVDVAVVDIGALAPEPDVLIQDLCDKTECRILLLADARRTALIDRALPRRVPQVGFIAKDSPPARLLEGVRGMAQGRPFMDPELALAAMTARDNPLTCRELDVLRLAARGLRVDDIAEDLSLARGTVRNHLSHIISKTGARTRIEAIRIAEEAGWLWAARPGR